MAYLFDRRHMSPQPRAVASREHDSVARHRVRFSYVSTGGHVVEESHAIPWLAAYRGLCAAFARGTLIATASGPVAVEDLLPGDAVLTNDAGAQPLRWIGSTTLRLRGGGADTDAGGVLRMLGDRLGPGRPSPDLLLHESARVLMPQETYGGPQGALVPLASLVDDVSVIRLRPVSPLEFFNLALDRHQIISANGVATESFHPGALLQDGSTLTGQVLDRLFPYLDGLRDGFGRPCRHRRDSGQDISAA